MRCEPFIAAVRSDRFRIVRDNCVIKDFSKLRSEFHYKQRRARQLQGKRSACQGGPASPENDANRRWRDIRRQSRRAQSTR
jgi:hypothetical protein